VPSRLCAAGRPTPKPFRCAAFWFSSIGLPHPGSQSLGKGLFGKPSDSTFGSPGQARREELEGRRESRRATGRVTAFDARFSPQHGPAPPEDHLNHPGACAWFAVSCGGSRPAERRRERSGSFAQPRVAHSRLFSVPPTGHKPAGEGGVGALRGLRLSSRQPRLLSGAIERRSGQ
jgi:hypothetical protein